MSTPVDTHAPATAPHSRATAALQLLRAVGHVIAVGCIGLWGFLAWPLPFPGVLTGLGLLALAIVVWALFLSPRPVLRTDRFGQAFIELLFIAAAVAAMLDAGIPWVLAGVFGVVAAVLGYLVPARLRSSAAA